MMNGRHPLYRAAIAADEAFSRALAEAGMDRWETPNRDYTPAVREAYLAKVDADYAWSDAMRKGATGKPFHCSFCNARITEYPCYACGVR